MSCRQNQAQYYECLDTISCMCSNASRHAIISESYVSVVYSNVESPAASCGGMIVQFACRREHFGRLSRCTGFRRKSNLPPRTKFTHDQGFPHANVFEQARHARK